MKPKFSLKLSDETIKRIRLEIQNNPKLLEEEIKDHEISEPQTLDSSFTNALLDATILI